MRIAECHVPGPYRLNFLGDFTFLLLPLGNRHDYFLQLFGLQIQVNASALVHHGIFSQAEVLVTDMPEKEPFPGFETGQVHPAHRI